jgi:Xaa-Pro aminopeptidase
MMKMGHGHPSVSEWCASNLPQGARVGFDPALVSASRAKAVTERFTSKGLEFVPVAENLVNSVWADRPKISQNKVIVHELQFAGRTAEEKLALTLEKFSSPHLFTGVLDEIAWILNLRGTDIVYNPLFFSYLLISKRENSAKLTLFMDEGKLDNVQDYIQQLGIEVRGYETVGDYLSQISEEVVIDEDELNSSLFSRLQKPINTPSIIARIKSIKTPREIQGFKDSHLRDGVAMSKYLSWLEYHLHSGTSLTEWTSALELDSLRANESLNMGLSFENISSSGPNAAIIHYAPTSSSARALSLSEIYLLDSGGQYLDGTIDTTRTMHFGEPTAHEKECFTRVLLGNLDLERLVWPASARLTGNDMDVLARRRLWEVGLDYNHATGHGVGYFLNVHEGPQVLCKGSDEVFSEGMNITNEPGYYEEGQFGIRIENVLFVRKDEKNQGFLRFENVTMVPYDKKLMDFGIMSREDVEYVNRYHEEVMGKVGKVLEERGEKRALEWLRRATSRIELDR